jgi:hypothetical protein
MKFNFIVEEEIDGIVEQFNFNLENNMLFKGKGITKIIKLVYNLEMEYLYPLSYTLYVWGILAVIGIVLMNSIIYIGAGILLFITAVLMSEYFYFVMLKIGLRKKGYKGKIKLVRIKN